jgi:hypothetical protein
VPPQRIQRPAAINNMLIAQAADYAEAILRRLVSDLELMTPA